MPPAVERCELCPAQRKAVGDSHFVFRSGGSGPFDQERPACPPAPADGEVLEHAEHAP